MAELERNFVLSSAYAMIPEKTPDGEASRDESA